MSLIIYELLQFYFKLQIFFNQKLAKKYNNKKLPIRTTIFMQFKKCLLPALVTGLTARAHSSPIKCMRRNATHNKWTHKMLFCTSYKFDLIAAEISLKYIHQNKLYMFI